MQKKGKMQARTSKKYLTIIPLIKANDFRDNTNYFVSKAVLFAYNPKIAIGCIPDMLEN